jgi:hypothetical protein
MEKVLSVAFLELLHPSTIIEPSPSTQSAMFTLFAGKHLYAYLAASTQQLAAIGHANAKAASRLLGILVVIFSLGLGGAELASMNLDRFALPLGLTLFVMVIGIRVWARSSSRLLAPGQQ